MGKENYQTIDCPLVKAGDSIINLDEVLIVTKNTIVFKNGVQCPGLSVKTHQELMSYFDSAESS